MRVAHQPHRLQAAPSTGLAVGSTLTQAVSRMAGTTRVGVAETVVPDVLQRLDVVGGHPDADVRAEALAWLSDLARG